MRFFLSIFSIFCLSVAHAQSDGLGGTDKDTILDECIVVDGGDSNPLDDLHDYLNSSFCTPAVWFDSFFSNERIDDEVRPGSRVRLQNNYLKDEFGVSTYTTKFRGSFRLPQASKNLRLVFEGDPEESVEDIIPSSIEETESQIGLIYELLQSQRAKLNLRVNLTPSATLRYRYNFPISELFSTQFIEQIFYKDSSFGSSTQVDFIKPFSQELIFRQSSVVSRVQDDRESIWSLSAVLFQRLSAIDALSYEASYSGTSEPEIFSDNQRVAVRYRRQFFRKWLFYEVAPEITWPRKTPNEARTETKAIFLRLEINFVNL